MSTGFLTHSTHVVQTTEYARDLPRHFEAIERLHADHFGHHRPTSTVVGVVDLALPEQLVEIAAIAVLPSPHLMRPDHREEHRTMPVQDALGHVGQAPAVPHERHHA